MCEKCDNTNNWKFCPYCGNEINKEPQEDKTDMTQDKFDAIFLDMLRKSNRVVWINNSGTKSDLPTCDFELRTDNGSWMFYISLKAGNPKFWFSHYRVRNVFREKYGLTDVDIKRLMKNQLKLLFNMDEVTPEHCVVRLAKD